MTKKNVNQEETNKLINKISELESGWKRTQADFENFRKRTDQERINLIGSANADLISKLTPTLDNFHRANKHVPNEIAKNDWVKGIYYIEKNLTDILKEEGLTVISTKPGDKFDPNIHHAIAHEINDKFPIDMISEVVENGYMFSGNVIKPSLVKVSKGK